MRNRSISLLAGSLLLSVATLCADDKKHLQKEAEESQAKADKAQDKADKAQAKADKDAALYDDKLYREYLHDTHKAEKEWDKLEKKEREAYYKWAKKHKH